MAAWSLVLACGASGRQPTMAPPRGTSHVLDTVDDNFFTLNTLFGGTNGSAIIIYFFQPTTTMETRPITKVERNGKRLFVELGKESKKPIMYKGEELVPPPAQGDYVMLAVIRKIPDSTLEKLIGMKIRLHGMHGGDTEEGVLLKNPRFGNEPMYPDDACEFPFILVRKDRTIVFLRDVSVTDLEVLGEAAEKELPTIRCIKCKKNIDIDSAYCRYCGKKQPDMKIR